HGFLMKKCSDLPLQMLFHPDSSDPTGLSSALSSSLTPSNRLLQSIRRSFEGVFFPFAGGQSSESHEKVEQSQKRLSLLELHLFCKDFCFGMVPLDFCFLHEVLYFSDASCPSSHDFFFA